MRKLVRIAMLCVLTAGLIVVPAQAAFAADGCGADWHKQSDGHLNHTAYWSLAGGRGISIVHDGYVRFCTKENFWLDDWNRKVLLGYPSALESTVSETGNYVDGTFCVKEEVRVFVRNVENNAITTVTVGSSGFSYSTTSSTSDPIVTIFRKSWVCANTASKIDVSYAGGVVTGPTGDSYIDHIEYTTSVKMTYHYNGTLYAVDRALIENDYS